MHCRQKKNHCGSSSVISFSTIKTAITRHIYCVQPRPHCIENGNECYQRQICSNVRQHFYYLSTLLNELHSVAFSHMYFILSNHIERSTIIALLSNVNEPFDRARRMTKLFILQRTMSTISLRLFSREFVVWCERDLSHTNTELTMKIPENKFCTQRI